MKTENEDHKLLRSITKETITNEDELTDFGLQLGCPLSLIKQKRSDYPRNIAMASFEMVVEWWDCWGNTREENYRKVVDTLSSINKKCAAQSLQNVVQENQLLITNCIQGRISQSQGRDQNYLTNSASHRAIGSSAEASGLERNRHNPAICQNVADCTGTNYNRGNLAICSAADVVSQDSSNGNGDAGAVGPDRNNSNEGTEDNNGNINIVEITDEQEGNREQTIERESYEIEYAPSEQNRSIQNGVADIFEGSGTATSSNETQKTRPIDISQLDQAGSIAPNIKNNLGNGASYDDSDVFDQKDTESPVRLTAENLDDLGEETGSERGRGIKHSQQPPVHRDVWVDIFENEDIADSKDTLLRRISTRHERDSASLESDNEEEDLNVDISPQSRLRSHGTSSINDQDVVYPLLPEVHINKTPNHDSTVYGQTGEMDTGVGNSRIDVVNGHRIAMSSQTGVANSRDSRKSVGNNQTGVMKGQTGVTNGQIVVVNDQTASLDGQTGVVNDHTGVVYGQTGVVNGQTGVVYGQTGVVNGQTGVVNGQTGVVNGQTGVVNGQTGVVKGQTGRMNGQTDIQNGHTGIVNGQAGAVNGRTGVVNGQTGVVNGHKVGVGGQTGTLNREIIDENRGVGKSRSKGFLHRLFRLFRRKGTNVSRKDEELAIATSGETEL